MNGRSRTGNRSHPLRRSRSRSKLQKAKQGTEVTLSKSSSPKQKNTEAVPSQSSSLLRPKSSNPQPLVRTRSVAEELSMISLEFSQRPKKMPQRPQSAKVLTSSQRRRPLPDLLKNLDESAHQEDLVPKPPATDRPRSACARITHRAACSRPPRPLCAAKVFPFSKLPYDMQLRVLSYLTDIEKGRVMLVSKEWFQLIRTPSLWTVIDFTTLPLCFENHYCVQQCYEKYCIRVQGYFNFLNTVRPPIKRLCFQYDLADNWLNAIEDFLINSNTKRMQFAQINWKETPIRPFWNYNLCNPDISNEAFSQRSKLRLGMFMQFFDLFTQIAPALKKLVIPFDWSETTVQMMKRFKRLETLVIEKYFVFQNIRQSALDGLMKSLPSLERLLLEIWAPVGSSVTLYHMASESLEYLDISQCRGFYLESLDMPKLRVFKAKRRPWNGPVVAVDTISLPCIYGILAEGTPNLTFVNDLTLEPHWKDDLYPELDEHLKTVCSCRKHKSGWAM